jgi:hypothetical protein
MIGRPARKHGHDLIIDLAFVPNRDRVCDHIACANWRGFVNCIACFGEQSTMANIFCSGVMRWP